MIALCIGDVGGHGDAACGHDGEVGDRPFRPVLADQNHPVAILQAQLAQGLRQAADLPCGFGPGDGAPFAVLLGGKEGPVAPLVGPLKEQRDQVGGILEIGKLHFGLPLSWRCAGLPGCHGAMA